MEQQQLKRCSIRIQTFEKVIKENYLIYRWPRYLQILFSEPSPSFWQVVADLPLHSYCAGRKDLFKGLSIEKLETEWTEYLVLRFIPNKSEELSSKQRGGLRAGWMFMLGVEEIKGKRIYLLFVSDFFCYLYKNLFVMMKQKEEILYAIKEVIAQVMPTGARMVLFGSQARNDASEDSDWDILILLDKEKLEEADHDKYVYPLFELGWKIDVEIHPIMYTLEDWLERNFSLFYKNVEQDGIVLC